MVDDGDIVRGLGFVVIYAAHLESRIDNILCMLDPVETYTEEEKKWQISKKIKKTKSIISKFNDPLATQILEELDLCKEHFERRNEVIHGIISSPQYHGKNLESSRKNVSSRAVNSQELYELATQLQNLNNALYRPISLRDLIVQKLNGNI